MASSRDCGVQPVRLSEALEALAASRSGAHPQQEQKPDKWGSGERWESPPPPLVSQVNTGSRRN